MKQNKSKELRNTELRYFFTIFFTCIVLFLLMLLVLYLVYVIVDVHPYVKASLAIIAFVASSVLSYYIGNTDLITRLIDVIHKD